MKENSYCIVIPHYQQYENFKAFLPKILKLGITCIVVDDGSAEKIKKRMRGRITYTSKKLNCECHLIEHDENKGKGAAILTGSRIARNFGFTHILQIDADGQHDADDINDFIELSKENPLDIIAGNPIFDETVPKERLYGRKITDFFVAIETLSLNIEDSLCGFRLYPLEHFEKVHKEYSIGSRMDFDTDILVKLVWIEAQFRFIDTQVVYLDDNSSHFNYLKDNGHLVWLHMRLLGGLILHLPKLIKSRMSGHKSVWT